MPFADADRVVMVWRTQATSASQRNTPHCQLLQLKELNRSFTDIAATARSANLPPMGR
jgi:hypothetical protein